MASSSSWTTPRKGRGLGRARADDGSSVQSTASPPSEARVRKEKKAKLSGDAKSSVTSNPKQRATPKTRNFSKALFADFEGGPRRFHPSASALNPKAAYGRYREAVDLRMVGFFQLDPRTWVAEIHDVDTGERLRGVDAWTVVQCHVDLAQRLTYTCSPCPDFKKYGSCVHVLVLSDPDPPPFKPFCDTDNPDCICFEHYVAEDPMYKVTTFACMTAAEKPVFLSHYGSSSRDGSWVCSKDNLALCSHVSRAKKNSAFIAFMTSKAEEPNCALGNEDVEESGDEEDGGEELLQAAAERERADKKSMKDLYDERSVSWRPVGPPAWCRLPSDKSPSFRTIDKIPDQLPLGEGARCRCGSNADPTAARRFIPCTVYGSASAHRVEIEVSPCPSCRVEARQFAGPDLQELGLFNFNNRRIFTHELLNGFTNHLSAHETPFHAFCTVVRRSYCETQSAIDFIADDAFRTAWFSFTRVQDLGDSFQCSVCGPDPKVVIFDGVTASFSNKHQTSTLCPPTLLQPGAPRRDAQTPFETTALVAGKLRLKAQKAVRWRMQLHGGKSKLGGIAPDDDDDDDDDIADADADAVKASKQTTKRISRRDAADAEMRASLPAITGDLKRLNVHVAVLFDTFVPAPYDKDVEKFRKPYLELLEHIFAYESALLFVPEATWLSLRMLIAGDDTAAAVLLREVPAVGNVARQELQRFGAYTDELMGAVQYILDRAMRVRASLPSHDAEKAQELSGGGDWRETGSYYGRPSVRLRPEYPNLAGDRQVDRAVVTENGAGGIGCNKFYETYGKRGQTGGLMAAWCPHCVCLGFHCIPKGEGRNDVFSALFTRWAKPPEAVIYDFACALGPYCMLREPQFFGNTRFLIDGFHAKGHTRCTKACFISAYKKNSPDLAWVNSSAAECGNGGLLRIRRPLSYMSQRHAIIYAYTFLATWNRDRRINAKAASVPG